MDFIAKLAALVPKPRVNLTRFHGVFAPNSRHRVQVTPAQRGKGKKQAPDSKNWPDKTPEERHRSMTWMQRLKRVFDIDICEHCGGPVKVIACIEDATLVEQILKHLKQKVATRNIAAHPHILPTDRAPLSTDLFH